MRFAPSSTARFRTRFASSRSFGQPQMPSPVIRIAPHPSRFTVRPPPILKVLLIFDSAPNKDGIPVTDNPTPPARLNFANVLRSIIQPLLFSPFYFSRRSSSRQDGPAMAYPLLIEVPHHERILQSDESIRQ